MGLFDFSNLRNALGNVKSRLSYLETEIAELDRQISYMASLPLPYEDFASWVVDRYESMAERYQMELGMGDFFASNGTMKSHYMSKRPSNNNSESFAADYGRVCSLRFEMPKPNYSAAELEISYGFFMYAFKDEMKKAVKRALDEHFKERWPEEVGLPRDRRIIELEKLEAKRDELSAERDRITSELSTVTG